MVCSITFPLKKKKKKNNIPCGILHACYLQGIIKDTYQGQYAAVSGAHWKEIKAFTIKHEEPKNTANILMKIFF